MTPAKVPDAPTAVKATAGNGKAIVAFTAPASNGGTPLTGYNVISEPDDISVIGKVSPITVTGLTNGTPYTFKVTATNAVGTGGQSTASDPAVTPMAKIANPAIAGLAVPVVNIAPAVAADTAEYTAETVWGPADGRFTPNSVYTATITLTPNRGYTLTGVSANFFKVAGATATNLAGSGIVKAVFPKTAATITKAVILGVTPPVTGAIPKTIITASTEYMGTVAWLPADAKFAPGTAYTATITLTPKAGYTLSGVTENFFEIAGATTANDAGSGVVTAVFTETALAKISTAAITGITAPVAGAAATSANDTAEYTAVTEWSGDPFAPGTGYTSRITLTAKPGYTLTGVAKNFFKIAGATTENDAGSGVVTAVFPSTATTIASGEIPGVIPPVKGATAKTTLTATTYTGTISWEPAIVAGKFAAGTGYTATITLTPKAGYTLVGVGAVDFFTVGGTSMPATNVSGVVTAIFPETAALPQPL